MGGQWTEEDELSEKHEMFCREYIIDFNASQAAIRAGYLPTNAGQTGHALLNNPKITDRIQQLKRDRIARLQITGDRVVRELARIAFADITQITSFDNNGLRVKTSEEISQDHTAAIASLAQMSGKEGKSVKVKMHSKEKALELLGRHLGIFKDAEASQGMTIINMGVMGEKDLTKPKERTPEEEAEYQKNLAVVLSDE